MNQIKQGHGLRRVDYYHVHNNDYNNNNNMIYDNEQIWMAIHFN